MHWAIIFFNILNMIVRWLGVLLVLTSPSFAKESHDQLCECKPFTNAKNLDECYAFEKKREEKCHSKCFSIASNASDGSGVLSCLSHLMNHVLDVRLLNLKKTDPSQFQKEMKIQALFKKSVQNFVEHYSTVCEGSICGDNCYSNIKESFYGFRIKQAVAINDSKLKISTVKSEKANQYHQYFLEFVESLCQMPKVVWDGGSKPNQCQENAIGEIDHIIARYMILPENEGDVCAQLPNAPTK